MTARRKKKRDNLPLRPLLIGAAVAMVLAVVAFLASQEPLSRSLRTGLVTDTSCDAEVVDKLIPSELLPYKEYAYAIVEERKRQVLTGSELTEVSDVPQAVWDELLANAKIAAEARLERQKCGAMEEHLNNPSGWTSGAICEKVNDDRSCITAQDASCNGEPLIGKPDYDQFVDSWNDEALVRYYIPIACVCSFACVPGEGQKTVVDCPQYGSNRKTIDFGEGSVAKGEGVGRTTKEAYSAAQKAAVKQVRHEYECGGLECVRKIKQLFIDMYDGLVMCEKGCKVMKTYPRVELADLAWKPSTTSNWLLGGDCRKDNSTYTCEVELYIPEIKVETKCVRPSPSSLPHLNLSPSPSS